MVDDSFLLTHFLRFPLKCVSSGKMCQQSFVFPSYLIGVSTISDILHHYVINAFLGQVSISLVENKLAFRLTFRKYIRLGSISHHFSVIFYIQEENSYTLGTKYKSRSIRKYVEYKSCCGPRIGFESQHLIELMRKLGELERQGLQPEKIKSSLQTNKCDVN